MSNFTNFISGLWYIEEKLFVKAIMMWTTIATQRVPVISVIKHRTTPKNAAQIVSSRPLGMCVAEYIAVFIATAGQTPRAPTNGNNKIPLKRNS